MKGMNNVNKSITKNSNISVRHKKSDVKVKRDESERESLVRRILDVGPDYCEDDDDGFME